MKRGPYQKNKGLLCATRGCGEEASAKGLCRRCWQAQYMPAYRKKHKERERARKVLNRDRYRKTPHAREVNEAACVRWHKKHPEWRVEYRKKNRERIAEVQRNSVYGRLHGSTVEDYARLLKAQRGRCAICRRKASDFKRRLHFDHCHKSKKPRGLLCVACNIALGHLEKDPAKGARLLAYLAKYRVLYSSK